jgi:TonB family protein
MLLGLMLAGLAATQTATGPILAVPRTSPQSWFTPSDYPAIAMRENMQGSVSFMLDVDALGDVASCYVMGSSGWDALDRRTCELLKQRAKFYPASDAAGKPAASRYMSRFRWVMPSSPVPMSLWARVTRFRADAKGRIRGCATRIAGETPVLDVCDSISRLSGAELAQYGGQGSFDLVELHSESDALYPKGFTMPLGEILFERKAKLSVGEDGYIAACRMNGPERAAFLREYLDVCAPLWRYPLDGRWHRRRAALRVSLVRVAGSR